MLIKKPKYQATISLSILVVIASIILSSCGGGGEVPFYGRVVSVEVDNVSQPSQYTVTAEVIERPEITIFSILQKRLPDIITFDATEFYYDNDDLKPGVFFDGCYMLGTIDGNSVRVVSIHIA
ncbi:MAG: hypothetical protein J5569_02775 [Oscillospiraceae bacterium]|nr:hypothetical protein [Oscillospiraceae bacterium]